MKINKTQNGYQVVTSNNTVASKDNLSDAEARDLVRKIEAYKASRRNAVKSVNKNVSNARGKQK